MADSKISSLTGMRFIAILMIVISHLEFLRVYPGLGDFYFKYFHNATIGVDFFFLLSGFGLMWSDIKHNGFEICNKINLKNLITFGINHIKKIYPLYITTIIIGIPLAVFQAYTNGKAVSTIIKLCILKLSACVFLIQSAFGVTRLSHSFNEVCWFLSCLFCIYLVSPVCINLLKKFCVNLKMITLLLITLPCLSGITAFLFRQLEQHTFFDDLVYGSPYRRIIYVVFGMVLALLISKYKDDFKIKNINLWEIAVSIVLILWFLFRNTVFSAIPYISLIYVIDIIVAGLAVFFLAYNGGVISKFLSNPNMVYLGELAMYIFLIHYPIRMYLGEICTRFNPTPWYIPVIMILIIFAGTYQISKYLYMRKCRNL